MAKNLVGTGMVVVPAEQPRISLPTLFTCKMTIPSYCGSTFFLVFVFAIIGLILGLLSIIDMNGFMRKRFSKNFIALTTLLVCLLCGYGIYLGRFLRFNSWDVLTDPYSLFSKIWSSLHESAAWTMAFAFGGFLWILFLLMRSIIERKRT